MLHGQNVQFWIRLLQVSESLSASSAGEAGGAQAVFSAGIIDACAIAELGMLLRLASSYRYRLRLI